MEQTTFTAWEAWKLLNNMPFFRLQSKFASSLCKVINHSGADISLLATIFFKKDNSNG